MIIKIENGKIIIDGIEYIPKPEKVDDFDRFDLFFKYILLVEGGYSDHKSDKGGKTNYGIIDAVAKKHGFDVKSITKEQAKEIYKLDYYLKNNIDKINNDRLALSVFDWVVNSGNWAIKNLQKLLNDVLSISLTVDGVAGDKTIDAINSVENIDDFLNRYHKMQIGFYEKIAINNPSQKVFLTGWKNRVNKKIDFLKEMI